MSKANIALASSIGCCGINSDDSSASFDGNEPQSGNEDELLFAPNSIISPGTGTVILPRTSKLLKIINSGGLSTSWCIIGVINSRAYCYNLKQTGMY
jgi:hypothetical protein